MSISKVEITVEVIECGHENCHIPMIIESGYVNRRRNDHKDFYCPNGHANVFPNLDIRDKLKKKTK